MQSLHTGLIPYKEGFLKVSIAAYSTRSIPGLHIQADSFKTQMIKEKLLFIAKQKRLPLKMLRYHLIFDCHEIKQLKRKEQIDLDYSWLELPSLLIFLDLLKIKGKHEISTLATLGRLDFFKGIEHFHFKVLSDDLKNLSSQMKIVYDELAFHPPINFLLFDECFHLS